MPKVSDYLMRKMESRNAYKLCTSRQEEFLMFGMTLVFQLQTDAVSLLSSLPFPTHSLGSKLESFSPRKYLGLDTSADVPWYFK